jgi:hypothetical protein
MALWNRPTEVQNRHKLLTKSDAPRRSDRPVQIVERIRAAGPRMRGPHSSQQAFQRGDRAEAALNLRDGPRCGGTA